MACFLALECSSMEGSIALMEDKKKLNCLSYRSWKSSLKNRLITNSHSDKLPLEIKQSLISSKKTLSDIDFLAVGIGPGRWTGLRIAINTIKVLSFSLKIPVYTLNSLRIVAENKITQTQPIFVALNGFKNQVYSSKISSQKKINEKIQLLNFSNWCENMRKERKLINKTGPLLCISDLENFYPLPEDLKKSFLFKKDQPNALKLAEIVFNQKTQMKAKSWNQIKPFYYRSPLN